MRKLTWACVVTKVVPVRYLKEHQNQKVPKLGARAAVQGQVRAKSDSGSAKKSKSDSSDKSDSGPAKKSKSDSSVKSDSVTVKKIKEEQE